MSIKGCFRCCRRYPKPFNAAHSVTSQHFIMSDLRGRLSWWFWFKLCSKKMFTWTKVYERNDNYSRNHRRRKNQSVNRQSDTEVGTAHMLLLLRENKLLRFPIWLIRVQMTPDEDFILDRHPKWKNVIIGAGFSGEIFFLIMSIRKLLSVVINRQSSTVLFYLRHWQCKILTKPRKQLSHESASIHFVCRTTFRIIVLS
jgi:hypothetical protein